MASFGTLALLLAFGLLAGPAGDYGFASIRAAEHTPSAASLVLILMLLGAGSKAGLVPLHVWLPLAHPAAPSHVSALMSGVMTKVAVYGFIRVVFDLLGQPTWAASVVVLFLGGVTAVMGILYAMMEKDLKRLLAYSTIENIGVIFAGLGLAMAFQANGLSVCRRAGVHRRAVSCAKSFPLQEPAVLWCRRRPDRDGRAGHGKTRRADSPHAADELSCSDRLRRHFGAAAVQWLRFGMADFPGHPAQSGAAEWALKIMVPAAGAMLGAGGGFGRRLFRPGVRHLLSRPPAQRGRARRCRGRPLLPRRRWASLPSCACCAGILPGHGDRRTGAGRARADRREHADLRSAIPGSRSRRSPRAEVPTTVCWCFSSSPARRCSRPMSIHRFASDAIRRAPAWDCGFPDASPLHAIFGRQLRPADPPGVRQSRVSRTRTGRHAAPRRYSPRPLSDVDCVDLVWEALYAPLVGAVSRLPPSWLNRVQFLTIRHYLSLVFAALVFAASGACMMGLMFDSSPSRSSQMLAGAAVGAAADRARPQGQGAAVAAARAASAPTLSRSDRLAAKGSGARRERVMAVPRRALYRSSRHLGRRRPGADIRDRPAVQLVGGPDRHHRRCSAARASCWRWREWTSARSFGGIGASREMMFATLAEPAMIMIVFSLALIAGSTQLSTVADSCCHLPLGCGFRWRWR